MRTSTLLSSPARSFAEACWWHFPDHLATSHTFHSIFSTHVHTQEYCPIYKQAFWKTKWKNLTAPLGKVAAWWKDVLVSLSPPTPLLWNGFSAGFPPLWPVPFLSFANAEADRDYTDLARDRTWLPTFRNIFKSQIFSYSNTSHLSTGSARKLSCSWDTLSEGQVSKTES